MRNLGKIKTIIAALAILAVVFFAGLYVGARIPAENKLSGILNQAPTTSARENVDFSEFWQAWQLVEQKYVDIDKVKRQDMVYGAISGLLKSLGDPYSVFFPPKANEEFQSQIKGAFEGVGMEIGIRKGILTVVAPLKNTPAEKAGIKSGDQILKIDDKDATDLSVEEAVQMIRGPKGSTVKLTIARNGDATPRIIEVTRDVINIPVLDTATNQNAESKNITKTKIPDNVFVIRLYNFSENSAESFRNALREMYSEGKNKLILDLRNNPGGYLESSVDIASWFLPQGNVVVTEDFGKGSQRQHRSKGYNVFKNLPMVILINQGSASASEILAGAMQDYGVAKLIGEKSFGKGSVQELVPLDSNTSLKVTIAKWLTPKGHSISGNGLTPDIEVKITPQDEVAGHDPVMDKAVEVLQNWK